jgi:hypothetical protein
MAKNTKLGEKYKTEATSGKESTAATTKKKVVDESQWLFDEEKPKSSGKPYYDCKKCKKSVRVDHRSEHICKV